MGREKGEEGRRRKGISQEARKPRRDKVEVEKDGGINWRYCDSIFKTLKIVILDSGIMR
jgi:hypothetical protein